MSNTNKYRADLVAALHNADGTVITDAAAYTVPCGMNSILELNSRPVKLAPLLNALQGRNTTDKVIILSAWCGKDGSSYTGEYKVASVFVMYADR